MHNANKAVIWLGPQFDIAFFVSDYMECPNGMMILRSQACDGINHCGDGYDESTSAGCEGMICYNKGLRCFKDT